MDKFKSKNGASVSEEFALFNWSSAGKCEATTDEVSKVDTMFSQLE